MKKYYEDEVEFKKDLDVLGFRFGDRFGTVSFVVSFVDSRAGVEIAQVSCSTPINALRMLPSILEQKKLGVDDVKIIVEFVFDLKSRKSSDVAAEISPYMYFKKQDIEKKVDDKKDTK